MAKQPEFNPEDLSAEIPVKPGPSEPPPNTATETVSTNLEESIADDKGANDVDPSSASPSIPDVGATSAALPPAEPESPTMRLDHFLQICGVETGGQAKRMIQGGDVLLNGVIETRRRKKLVPGDEVEIYDEVFVVAEMEEVPTEDQ